MSIPHDYTAHLKAIASEIIERTVKPEGLEAIVLQGSVAKGLADEYSDIELMCIWSGSTTPESRAEVIEQLPKEPLFDEMFENFEWSSAFLYKSIKVDISHLEMPRLQATIDDVMAVRTTSIASQTLLASVQDSTALYGLEFFDTLLSQIKIYPKELSTKSVLVNALFAEWSMRRALLDRGDDVALHHLIDMTLLQLMRLLFALNETYLRSYNMKWIYYYASRLAVKPERFEARIASSLAGLNEQAIQELDGLLREVFALVQQHRPDIDVSAGLKTLQYTRQKLPPLQS